MATMNKVARVGGKVTIPRGAELKFDPETGDYQGFLLDSKPQPAIFRYRAIRPCPLWYWLMVYVAWLICAFVWYGKHR